MLVSLLADEVIHEAIWARELNPSLFRMLRTWLSTVRSEMNRRAPISLLLSPSATSRATPASRCPRKPGPLWSTAAAGGGGLAERQPHRGVPAQPSSGLELRFEPRRAEPRRRRRR